MYIDAENQYSDAQALAASGASTNLIDHGSDREMGMGEAMAVLITLDVAADDGDADETYQADLEVDSDSGFGSAVLLGSATITRGDAAGSKYVIPVPPDTNFDRYSRINFTLGGTTPSVTVTAQLMPQKFIDNYQEYASGFTVS